MSPTQSQILKIFILFCVYVAAARLGLSFYAVEGFATLVWPATGIALAALLLYGLELWPAIMLGAFTVNLLNGASPPVAIGIAFGNTLEAVAGAYILKRYIGIDFLLARLRDTLGLVSTSIFVSLLSASIGTTSLLLGGVIEADAFLKTWAAWWVGDALGALVLAPFLVRWLSRLRFRKTRAELVEGVALFATLAGVNFLIFWTPLTGPSVFPMFYLLFPPLVWAALRSGPRGMTLSLVMTSAIAISAALAHQGVFSGTDPQQALLALQLFTAFIVVLFLPFTSIVEAGKDALNSVEEKNEQLQQALARLAEEDKAKNEFLAILAHELRNPLSPVVSSLELMKLDAEEGKLVAPSLIDTAQTHLHTLTHLLDDLLDISRITRKQFKLKRETVELQSIIHHSVETVRPFYQSKGHNLSVAVPNEPIWVRVDPVRFQQVIVNILHNAAKYTEPSGRVYLSVRREKGGEVRIDIEDNGLGIEPSMLVRIFDPFTQGQTTAQTYSGLGIGLSLTKRLVELHEGNVWAESEGPGKGSRFSIVLPEPKAVQLPLGSVGGYARRSLPFMRSKAAKPSRLLIVDDNEAAAKGLSALLAHSGHTVAVCNSGASALEWVANNTADIILLDIGMPQMDGYEVARRIRASSFTDMPVLIALTGYGQEEDKRKARDAGFDFHLTKPVQVVEVERLLLASQKKLRRSRK